MQVERFDWDDDNIPHATAHGISVEQIESILRAATTSKPGKFFTERRTVTGRLTSGRLVLVVYDTRADGGIRPITAFPLRRNQ